MTAAATNSRIRVAILGATGFVGSAISNELAAQSVEVLRIASPRLQTEARSLTEVRSDLGRHEAEISSLALQIEGISAVVNAAGLAQPTGRSDDSLFGANALLPRLIDEACRRAGVRRMIHVSSAAVQGNVKTLDESDYHSPLTPYGTSKALGERVLLDQLRPGTSVLRPTSVHGAERDLTRQLIRFAKSPLASVASPGDAPTPQVTVSNVGAVAAFLLLCEIEPPAIVLQPWEGWSTASFLHQLSGRWPHLIRLGLARSGLRAMSALSGIPRVAAYHRRLELLWCGQEQAEGWLEEVGFALPYGRGAWDELVTSIARPTS